MSFAVLLTNQYHFIFPGHLFKSTIVIDRFNKIKLYINEREVTVRCVF